jgi:NAD(P)-dependent dehydrogenase (short-subunit alcohol dehydrogenase family)
MQKQVLITGVNGGIGQALAKGFKDAGYYVFGIDLEEGYDVECDRFIALDIDRYVREAEYRVHMTAILDQVVKRLDVLINNAAVQRLGRLDQVRLEDWQETFNVNLTGPMLLSKLFLQRLEDARGSIINIGSIHQQLTKPEFVAYATSKSALIGLTKALAVDLEDKVRVNAISPAAIETDMLREGFVNNPEALDHLEDLHPVKRIGLPEDVARLALFLAEESDGFIHGANFTLDGGISSVLTDVSNMIKKG